MNRIFYTGQSGAILVAFCLVGFLLNDLFHLYRFTRVDWTHVTGLFGNSQPLWLSFWMCTWFAIPIVLSKPLFRLIRYRRHTIVPFALALIVFNQACGRSVLKLVFDILLLCVLFVWYFIDDGYVKYLKSEPTEKALPYIRTELITLFQTSLAMLTFVITVFGFSFAPDYIEKYYQQSIGQPTVWWFSIMTTYVSIGVLIFICSFSWTLAIRLRSDL